MKMKNRLVVALLATLVTAGVSAIAHADIINIDPDGGGGASGTIQVQTFDYSPGNSLSVGGQTSVSTFIGTGGTVSPTFTTLFQASLGNFLNSGGGVITGTGLNSGYEITIVARFQENTTFATTGGGGIATFGLVPTQPNFIEIYFDSTPDANALAGTGYNDGTLILSGTVTQASSNFQVTGCCGNLDQNVTDNYPAIDSVSGQGSTTLTATVGFIDPNFFKDALAAITFTLFNTSNIVPFNQTDPSAAFVFLPGGVAPTTAGAGIGVASLGTVNGCFLGTTCGGGTGGPDVQFQTDANQSFQLRQVPEPASFLLFGFGLLGMGGYLRNRSRKNK